MASTSRRSRFRARFDGLSYSSKFLLVAALFVLPLVASVAAIMYGRYATVLAAAREHAGVECLRRLAPLRHDFELLGRLTYAVAIGNQQPQGRLTSVREQVEADFAGVQAVCGDERPSWSDALTSIRAGWAEQNVKSSPMTPERLERINTLTLEQLVTITKRVGDESGLSSDPDLVTSRVAAILVQDLGETQLLGEQGLQHARAVLDGRARMPVQLIVDATRLRSIVRDLNTEMHGAFFYDESGMLQPSIEQPLRDYVDAAEAFATQLDAIFAGERPATTAVAATARRMADAQMALADVVAEGLDQRLEVRLRRSLLELVVVGAGAIALLGTGLAGGLLLTRMISQPLADLIRATNRFAAGDIAVRTTVGSNDEVGRVAAAFNAMATEVGEARASLERRVEERTRELANALAVAQEALRARAEFVGTASHELRTPVAGLLGVSELWLAQTNPDDPTRLYAEKVYQCANQLASLTESLLDVSRLDTSRVELHREPIELEIVTSLLAELQVTAPTHVLRAEIDPEAPPVLADGTKLAQILRNLLSNAIKFSPRGGTVVVRGRFDQASGRVVISVADNGVGIAPADRARIFDRFERVETSETRGIRGVGLGLYIVRNLVELHEGTIEIESEVGCGTTFHVALPAAVARDSVEQAV